jgi:hypothetical protein
MMPKNGETPKAKVIEGHCTHLFGSHSQLLLKAPIWWYAPFWKPFTASFEGPYMVLRIFLEAILSFF